jgi:hypothetical protein
MKRIRILVGLTVWLVGGIALCGWLRGFLFTPQADGHRVAAELWQFASAPRRVVLVQFDAVWPVQVGDPIFRIEGPEAIEQVGEVRRVLGSADTPAGGPRAEILLYPQAPRLCPGTSLTCYTTPRSLSWVVETMLAPEKRVEIAQEIMATYEAYHAEILQAIKPVIVGGFFDALKVVEEDLAVAVASRREQLQQLGDRYQERVVDQELLPLLRQEIWPIARRHLEPLANQLGSEMLERASLWRFGWRLLYDKSPLPDKNLTLSEWNRFVEEEALPVFNRHAEDMVVVQRQMFEEIANSQQLREALQRNLTRVVDDPAFRAIVWDIFREVLIDNPRLRKKLEERWSGEEARRAMQLAADYAEPCVRRIGDLLFGTREAGIAPEFAQVLRNQILDKDCRWLVLETPADPASRPELPPEAVLSARIGGYPEVNPFAVQLQGIRP